MNQNNAKPFVKWAGGKSKVLKEIQLYYPFNDTITKYIEPFVGGGAVLFDILNQFNLSDVYICDTNQELMNCYTVIKNNPNDLIKELKVLEEEFIPYPNNIRTDIYNHIRNEYNIIKAEDKNKEILLASYFIFLNKTCFNGLYRVNKKDEFNVPIGKYKKPCICDEENILNVSQKLQNVNIICDDYWSTLKLVDEHTFIYIDPPYRPITETSNFTNYTKDSFFDKDQISLKKYIDYINATGAKVLASNSDPTNTNNTDNFFDDLYKNYNIKRIQVGRAINSNGKKRGKISELLISNF